MAVQRDTDHVAANRFYRSLERRLRLVTSNLVLSETYTWLAYRGHRRAAFEVERRVRAAQQVGRLTVAWVTPDVHERAWDIFRRYDDQVFSFCDCTSFVVARDEAVDFVFGFDGDFATMGFDLRPHIT